MPDRQRVAVRQSLLAAALVLSLVGVYLIQNAIERMRRQKDELKAADELMYFPSGRLLSQISGEYRGIVADYAWLLVAQYTGAHLGLTRQQENYAWVGHAIGAIGDLDPQFVQPFIFGAQLLAWNAERPGDAIDLLRKGMRNSQLDAELPFQAGFVAYEKLKDYSIAGHYFGLSSMMPEARATAQRMAAAAHRKAGDFDLSREIWYEIWKTHPNIKLKDIARTQLVDLQHLELDSLQAAVDRYRSDHGRAPSNLQDLIRAGYILQLPKEPFDGIYRLRGDRVVSTVVEQTLSVIGRLQRSVDLYRQRHRVAPARPEVLVEDGLLPEIPEEPMGGEWVIENGRVRTTTPLP